MKLNALLSTEEREAIIGYLLAHPSQEINLSKIAHELGLSAGQMHKYVAILRKAGLVSGKKLRETPLIRSLRLLFNIKRIEDAGAVASIKRHFPKAKGIGIYGSWASGTNLEAADLDIWVKIEKEPQDIEIAKAREEIEKKLGAAIDVTIATPERLAHFREKSDAFYFSLYNGKLLWGEGL